MMIGRSNSRFGIIALTTFILLPTAGLFAQVNLYVAADGSDSNNGTADAPLASLEGARQRIAFIRSEEQYRPQLITVTVGEGLYELSEPIAFTELDSGTSEFPITYRVDSGAKVILRGGTGVNNFQAVDGNSCEFDFPSIQHVWRLDLASFELKSEEVDDFGSRKRALHREMDAEPLHLVVDGKTQMLARWPNTGWAQVNTVGQDKNSWTAKTVALGKSNFPHGPHAWAHGFWMNDWEDECHRIEFSQSGSEANFRFSEKQNLEIQPHARFRVENLASQLDQDGECFFDADAKQAYVYSSSGVPKAAFVSRLVCPVSFYGVSHLNFVGFTIEGASSCGVEIAGGTHVALHECEIRHVGNTCVHIYHGDSHTVTACKLHDAGAGGIRIEAGDRSTLTPCNHRVANNSIHHYSHSHLAYRPAINAIGIGIIIEENVIHDGPHAAIILEGNELIVSNNKISHVCLETDDVGAIYMSGNPTYRGNRIEGNYIHSLGQAGRTGVIGIYLDDFTSGTVVRGNVLKAMPRGIAIGGGRDNLIENNVVVGCLAAIQADARGTTWASSFFTDSEWNYYQICQEAAANEAFAARYPDFVESMEDAPELPKGNRIVGNWIDSRIGIDLQDPPTKQLVTNENNVPDALRYLVDRAMGSSS